MTNWIYFCIIRQMAPLCGLVVVMSTARHVILLLGCLFFEPFGRPIRRRASLGKVRFITPVGALLHFSVKLLITFQKYLSTMLWLLLLCIIIVTFRCLYPLLICTKTQLELIWIVQKMFEISWIWRCINWIRGTIADYLLPRARFQTMKLLIRDRCIFLYEVWFDRSDIWKCDFNSTDIIEVWRCAIFKISGHLLTMALDADFEKLHLLIKRN